MAGREPAEAVVEPVRDEVRRRLGLPEHAVERVAERTRDSAVFDLGGGRRRLVVREGLHARSGRGQPWREVRPEIVRPGPGRWRLRGGWLNVDAEPGRLVARDAETGASIVWQMPGAEWDGEAVEHGGLVWRYEPTPAGIKAAATVAEPRGPQIYDWGVSGHGLRVSEAGSLVTEGLTVPRALVIGADGTEYPAGTWELADGTASFAFDDGELPDDAFPYVIDPSINSSVGAGGDDGYWTDSVFDNTETVAIWGKIGSAAHRAFFRFTGIAAANGEQIHSAYIDANGHTGHASGPAYRVVASIRASATDNPPAPVSVATARGPARTAASVTWDYDGSWSNSRRQTPDFANVIQELADNGYLASGVVLIYIEGDATLSGAFNNFRTWDHATSDPPMLVIDYGNTAPSFTAQPSASHGAGYTHIGPGNPTATVSFTAVDPEQSTLAYTVKRGATVVTSGNVQTGARSIAVAYGAPGLTEGANSLTLTLDDGQGGVVVSSAFTVYRDTVAPTNPTGISHSPNPVTTTRQYTLTFTPGDATSTGASQMRYEVWTGPGASGTRLAGPTSCTSGSQVTTPTLSDSGLANGTNTRYLRTRDGAGNWRETAVAVEALLQVPQEVVAGIAGAAVVEAAVTVARRVAVDVAGATQVEARATAASLVGVDVAGAALVDVRPSAPAGVAVAVFGGAWVSARLLPAAYIEADIAAWASVEAPVQVRRLLGVEVAGAATVASGITAPAGLVVDIAGAAVVRARAALVPEIAVEIAGAATVEAVVSFNADIVVGIAGRAVVEATLQEYQTPGGFGLRADLFDAAGEPLASGPLMDILGGEYEAGLDEVGAFSLAIPAADPAAAGVADGVRLNLYRAGEGLVFRGVIGASDVIVGPDGRDVMTISGDSLARELVWRSTMIGTEYANEPLPAVVGDLLGDTGWTAYGVASDARNVTAQYTGLSRWQALVKAAELYGWHVRERNLARQVEVGPLGGSSGLVLSNVVALSPAGEMAVKPVARLAITDRQDELWNRVAPLGGGAGINALTRAYSARAGPYPIQAAPDATASRTGTSRTRRASPPTGRGSGC